MPFTTYVRWSLDQAPTRAWRDLLADRFVRWLAVRGLDPAPFGLTGLTASGAVASPDDWIASGAIADFVRDEKSGTIIRNDQANVRIAVTKLGCTLRYNTFAHTMIAVLDGQLQVVDDAWINDTWLRLDEHFHFRPELEFFRIVVGNAARRDAFHPVCEYLDGLTWDGTPRLDTWLITYGGAADTAYVRAVGALFLTAAVRRVRSPGVQFDELLILESAEGRDKSSALRALCPDPSWFSDDLPLDLVSRDAKQLIERTSGKWLIEIADLHGFAEADVDRLKSLLSRRADGPVRLAWGRLPVEIPRQFILAGTTNQLTQYFHGMTGHRRLWPVRVQQFDLAALTRDRDQLWAEAAARDAVRVSIRLSRTLWPAAAAEQEARRRVDPYEELLDAQLDFTQDVILADDTWCAIGKPGEFYRTADATRIAAVMQRRGFTKKEKIRVQIVTIGGDEAVIEQVVKPRWVWLRDGVDSARVRVEIIEVPSPNGHTARREIRVLQAPVH